jgi:hypothetical protein
MLSVGGLAWDDDTVKAVLAGMSGEALSTWWLPVRSMPDAHTIALPASQRLLTVTSTRAI